MIVPMTKYSFLLYHRDFDNFLTKLQELGVVDIVKENRCVDEGEKEILAKIGQYNGTIKYLSAREVEGAKAAVSLNADQMVDRVDAILKEREQLENAVKKSQKELAEVIPWGAYDQNLVEKLGEKGIKVRYFNASERVFKEEWLQQYPIEVINHVNGLVYFVMVDPSVLLKSTATQFVNASENVESAKDTTNATSDDLNTLDVLTANYYMTEGAYGIVPPSDVTEMRQPQYSSSEKDAEIAGLQSRIGAINRELDGYAQNVETIKTAQVELTNKLDFKVAESCAEKEADDMLMTLQGWAPEPKIEELDKFLDDEGVIYIAEKATKDDNAPILFHNGWFARLFEPITRLYSFPIYGEMDLTPFFAPFYMMFFGFCLGDAGYGLLFVVLALLLRPKASAVMKPILSLAIFLGIGAVIFGMLTGTLFGASLAAVPALVEYKNMFLSQDMMFPLSMGIGVVQIIFGMCLKAINLALMAGWRYAIGTIGWIIMLVSTIAAYCADGLFGTVHMVFVVVSAVAIFFLNSPGKNPLVNFGSGLWNTYNMVTGLLGDVLSYIRLFALGLSGGILGGVFNSLAFGMAPDIPVVKQLVILLILLIGHGINIFMSTLGSLVHPVRLTFVEFYKNAGFIGGGKEYQPFQRK